MMWILLVITLWSNGSEAKSLRSFDERQECQHAIDALQAGDHTTQAEQVYYCVRKPQER